MGPKGVAVDRNGHIIVVDNKACCVFIFQSNGKLVTKFGSRGTAERQFAGTLDGNTPMGKFPLPYCMPLAARWLGAGPGEYCMPAPCRREPTQRHRGTWGWGRGWCGLWARVVGLVLGPGSGFQCRVFFWVLALVGGAGLRVPVLGPGFWRWCGF